MPDLDHEETGMKPQAAKPGPPSGPTSNEKAEASADPSGPVEERELDWGDGVELKWFRSLDED